MASGPFVLQAVDDGVQPLDQERLRREHVAGAAHHPAVTARTFDADVESVRPRPQQPGLGDYGSRLDEAGDVQPDHRVWMVLVQKSSGDHRLRTAHDLFRRLEHKEVAAAQVVDAIDQRASDAEHHGDVRVVAACVHATLLVGLKVDA